MMTHYGMGLLGGGDLSAIFVAWENAKVIYLLSIRNSGSTWKKGMKRH
jgi:hypothetical protein